MGAPEWCGPLHACGCAWRVAGAWQLPLLLVQETAFGLRCHVCLHPAHLLRRTMRVYSAPGDAPDEPSAFSARNSNCALRWGAMLPPLAAAHAASGAAPARHIPTCFAPPPLCTLPARMMFTSCGWPVACLRCLLTFSTSSHPC